MVTRSTLHRVAPILRWIFRRNDEILTCEVDVTSGHRYEVCVIPHWDVSQSVVERFRAPLSAFERHAEIARQLRAGGWMVTGRDARHRGTPVVAASVCQSQRSA
jgi:hypothetical protein